MLRKREFKSSLRCAKLLSHRVHGSPVKAGDFLLARVFSKVLIAHRLAHSRDQHLTRITMAKPLTKSQIAATLAEKVGISKKQGVEVLELVAQLAYKNAKNTFTLPGLGKLVLV